MTTSTTRRLDYATLALTVLAALPYELGTIATVIPPAWKPWVVFAGIVAKLILSEVKNQSMEKVEGVAEVLKEKNEDGPTVGQKPV